MGIISFSTNFVSACGAHKGPWLGAISFPPGRAFQLVGPVQYDVQLFGGGWGFLFFDHEEMLPVWRYVVVSQS
jgi:hypothetical protein